MGARSPSQQQRSGGGVGVGSSLSFSTTAITWKGGGWVLAFLLNNSDQVEGRGGVLAVPSKQMEDDCESFHRLYC
jgi:hypothetical protein